MKKLCILCNGYGLVSRGAERLTEGIYNLLKDDYEVTIESAQSTNTKKRDEFSIPHRNTRAYLESYYFGKQWFKQNTKDYDLIINNAGFPGSYWCNKYRKRTGTPFISLERGGGREERLNNLFKPDKMVFLTEYSMNKSKYKKKAHLPAGVDTKKFTRNRPFVQNNIERPIFLSTSAMVKFKRIPLIIRALELYGKGSLIQTSVGGRQSEINEFGKVLGNNYHYFGKVDDNLLISLYQHSDYLVSASKHEAFGLIYLEAMAAGLPIIAQDDSRRREIIGESGKLVSWENPGCLNDLVLSFDKKKIKERAQLFDWKTLKPRYIDLIEEVTCPT